MHRTRLLVLCSVFLAGMFVAGLWTGTRWKNSRDVQMRLPLGPGREVIVAVWTLRKVYIDKDYNHSAAIVLTDQPLRISMWYQDTQVARIRQLMEVHVPSWPLAMIAVGLWMITLCLWRVDRRRRERPG